VEGAYQQLDKEPSPSVVEIFVVKGKIIGEARKLNPQSSFTIKSPAGVARIRGTVYSVEYSRNETTRTGNMEVGCVKGSVEVTVNGSDSGSQAVEPGKKITAQTPLVDSSEDSKRVPAVPVKVVVPAAVENSPQVNLASTEGLVIGSEVKAPGVPSGVTVVSIENGKVTFSEPINLPAGTEITIDPPPGATYLPANKLKNVIADSVIGKNVIKMQDVTGLKPGMKLAADGFPSDVTIVSVDAETRLVTLSSPVTVNAGTKVVPLDNKTKTQVVANAVTGKNVISMEDVTGLRPGMKITYIETDSDPTRKTNTTVFPDDVVIVSIDSVNNTVTLNVPVTVNAKTRFLPVFEPLPPAPITNPIITFSNLGQDEVKSIADDLSKGTSLPTELKEQVNNIADKTPPAVPPTSPDGTPAEKPTTPPGGPTSPVNDVMDAINKTIQETIEKENQKNPSPTQ
jgi:hypothetical protein